MQTATADPLVGRLLEGRYRIVDRIARGGMSIVYAAVDERLDRRVAVKVMSSALSSDPAFSDRFAREARAAARLTHVNTVAVYDQGHDSSAAGGHHVFLVMELVQGRTLRDLIRERAGEQGRFTPAEAISIMEPVLSALSAAHRAGLVHRDVKPENILLSDDGLVKVADFGLARAVDADAASTRTGLMMGTVAYCAPEQIVHGRSDQRSDVYSAGDRAVRAADRASALPGRLGDERRLPARAQPGACAVVADQATAVPDPDADRRDRRRRDRQRPVRDARRTPPAFLAEIADARVQLALPVVPIPPRRGAATNGVATRDRCHPVPSAARPAGTTDVTAQRRPPGRHDTEIVQQRPACDAPPPPVVIPPPSGHSPRVRGGAGAGSSRSSWCVLVGALSVFGGITGVRLWRE